MTLNPPDTPERASLPAAIPRDLQLHASCETEKLRRFKSRISFVLMKTWSSESQDVGNYRILQRPGFCGFVVVVDDIHKN